MAADVLAVDVSEGSPRPWVYMADSGRLDELKSKEDDEEQVGSWRLSLDTRGLPMETVCLS